MQRSVKYLGVTLERGMTFRKHLAEVSGRAVKAATAVARLMPNIGGPSSIKRATLMSVAKSRLLYAAPAWAEQATQYRCNTAAMTRVQRFAALRIIRGYRTVSGEAAMALAGTPPADLLAVERAQQMRLRSENPALEIMTERKEVIKNAKMATWQDRWSADTGTATWTKRLLLNIKSWLKGARKLIMSYHLTQALSDHGYFRAYLHKRARASTPFCLWCPEEDDAEHTIFKCTKYTAERAALTCRLGKDQTAENVQTLLSGDERIRYILFEPLACNIEHEEDRKRNLFVDMVERILKNKEDDERRRQDESRGTAAAARRGANRRERGHGAVPGRGRN